MSSTGLRELKKQRQREAIVDAAVALFRERGFEETRVQDILERAEISLGTFYNYFPGKDAVLDDFGARVLASYLELASHELEAEGQPVGDRLRALARACGRAFSSDPAFMTIVVAKSRAFGGRVELPTDDPPIYGLLSLMFEEGQASGEIKPELVPVELAEVYSGIFMFTVVSWLTAWQASPETESEATLDVRLARALEVFLSGATEAAAPTGARRRP
jgi:AcrR family transcriptional regulator